MCCNINSLCLDGRNVFSPYDASNATLIEIFGRRLYTLFDPLLDAVPADGRSVPTMMEIPIHIHCSSKDSLESLDH
jgi:hypothetical protein